MPPNSLKKKASINILNKNRNTTSYTTGVVVVSVEFIKCIFHFGMMAGNTSSKHNPTPRYNLVTCFPSQDVKTCRA